jgi:hypothetical protein
MLLVALTVLSSSAEAAITCSAVAHRERGWVWRQVDGKRCWYKGSRRVPKGQLVWHVERPKALPLKSAEPKPETKPETKPDSFNERWWGEQKW